MTTSPVGVRTFVVRSVNATTVPSTAADVPSKLT